MEGLDLQSSNLLHSHSELIFLRCDEEESNLVLVQFFLLSTWRICEYCRITSNFQQFSVHRFSMFP